jgi:hypothetical protein
MISQRDGRSTSHGDEARRSKQSNDDNASRERAGNPARAMTVKCPNPECGLVKSVPAAWAGKKGSCPECKSTFYFPTTAASPLSVPSAADIAPSRDSKTDNSDGQWNGQEPSYAPPERATEPAIVRAGCIGRGNAGKTALFRALADGPIGDFLPSGLHADAGDPREVARMIRESEDTQRLLHLAGLPPTLAASQISYFLYEGAERRVAFQMHEVIGQVLTHTLPDSASEQQARYEEYLSSLVNTQVLWAVVPCPPPNPGSRERRRYANDLRITLAYLREALRLRALKQPLAVALVLSKIDTLFTDESAARGALSDEVLRGALGPLVDLIENSSQVYAGAIFPVTVFGFGNAVVNGQGEQREGTAAASIDEPFGNEPVWILRDGADAQPFNLDSLFLWTLLFGLKDPEACGEAVRQVGLKLEQDLNAADPWLLTVK